MAKSSRKRRAELSQPQNHKEILGIAFLALGIFVTLCLLSYSPQDPAFNVASKASQISNLGGVIGAYLSDILFTVLGISAYFLCGILFLMSLLQFMGRSFSIRWQEFLSYTFFIFFTSLFFHLQIEHLTLKNHQYPSGGLIGSLAGGLLVHYLNEVGAYILTLTGMILTFVLATHLKMSSLFINLYRVMVYFSQNALQWGQVKFQRTKEALSELWALFDKKLQALFQKRTAKTKTPRPAIRHRKALAIDAENEDEDENEDEEGEEYEEEEEEDEEEEEQQSVEPKIFTRADVGEKKNKGEQLQFLKLSSASHTPPPISLLDSDKIKVTEIDENVLKKNALLLEKKLQDYDVKGKITEIHPGPVITMYEFEPAPGTKVNKIVNLETDLSLNMGGRAVRILPHLPGKPAVGIEIPNQEREIVWLKEIIASPQYQKSKSSLTLCLGKDTEGRPVTTDLAKMPHLLVAGATGAGKSVGINSMLISMLYKASPEQVRFILVDPKMLELSIYEGIPHLLLPVVTQPKKAVVALKWAVKEMERRYRLLANAGVRNIAGYNEKIKKGTLKIVSEEAAAAKLEENNEAICHTGELFYLVIIIDELADLMMVASSDIEESIARLAQMARAAGIHLILATQRPSVDVITGVIKANFPARISFKVSSKHDSRTILDQIGSENLLGNGDMLFMSPTASLINRVHGTYVTEDEIGRIINHLKDQGQPEYNTAILESAESLETNDDDEETDELYDQAVKLVAQTRQASISMIQRRLRIGYNRAARMVEKMETEGVVGPQDGSKPRQVLVSALE